ncbi:MAG: M48 family metalloprotease [Mariprofundaceae bacterium]
MKVLMFMCGIWVGAIPAFGLEVNDDGRALLTEAAETYAGDVRERPLVEDRAVSAYVEQVAMRLARAGPALPAGVSIKVGIVESGIPELYSYADGHLLITTALLYSMQNEAQLAAVISHEIAHIAEGHYLELYQQSKAQERKNRNMAIVGAVIGGLMDVAVDTAAEYKKVDEEEKLLSGEATYGQTMKKVAIIEGARSSYFTMKDVATSIPPEDSQGHPMDPRFQFEPMADAQGLVYLAKAGYDIKEAPKAWANVARLRNRQLKEREAVLGDMGRQMNQLQSMMEKQSRTMVKAGVMSGLAQTISVAPRGRAEFVASLQNMKEVRDVAGGREKGEAPFQQFLSRTLLAKANQAMEQERYEEAYRQYRAIYDAGIHSAPVAYGLAKSKLGDFAFGASEQDKRSSEKLYHEALAMDKSYAPAWKGLAELYEDSDRYEEAIDAYKSYERLAPSSEKKRLGRKIRTLKRKASR